MQVEQRHRDAAADYCEANGELEACLFIRRGNDHPLSEAFARFEASLPPSAPVDVPKPWTMDAARELHAGMIQAARDCAGSHGAPQSEVREAGSMFLYRALLGTPSVLAESTSNDCLLVAEAVRERCAKEAEARRDSYVEPTDWDYGAQDACFSIASAIRSLDLSGVGVG